MNTISKKITAGFFCLTLIVGLIGLAPVSPAQAIPSASQFGYTYTLIDPVWENMTDHELAYLVDNETSAQQAIGFEFKFYEKNYTNVYINANGFITFQPLGAGYNYNKPIPLDDLPNAMIAPFWTDLVVSPTYPVGDGGKVYCGVIGAAEPNRKFVITWHNATRLAGTETMSFQIVLYEADGSIDINYQSMISNTDPATIGIEDSDGVDGTQLLYNGSAASGFDIAQRKSIHFAYPVSGYRLKALPPFASGFFVNGFVTLPVTVVNTSDLIAGTDTYDLSAEKLNHVGEAEWGITMQDGSGNLLTNTGAVPSGGSKTVYARLRAPLTAPIGSYLRLNLTFTSTKISKPKTTVTLQAAVPSPFVQGFALDFTSSADYPKAGTFMQLNTSLNGLVKTVNPGRLGRDIFQSMTITSTTSIPQYFVAWAYNNAGDSYNIQYSLANLFASADPVIKTLIANPINYYDQYPIAATNSNGVTGIVYIQDYKPDNVNVQQNVFFARLDPNGNPLATPNGTTQVGFNITNNTQAGTHGKNGYPFFSSARIIAMPNNHFVVAWVKEEAIADHIHQDIGFAAFDPTTGQMECGLPTCPRYLTNSTLTVNYSNPTLSAGSAASNAMLTYLSTASSGANFYGRLLTEAGPMGGSMELGRISAGEIDAAELWGGNLLAAWVDPLTAQLHYGLWTKGGDVVKADTTLAAPDSHNAYKVSVTNDALGNGILTWSNQSNSRLYYTLLNSTGTVLTPAMIQISAPAGAKSLTMGSGIASAAAFRETVHWNFSPIVLKKVLVTYKTMLPHVSK